MRKPLSMDERMLVEDGDMVSVGEAISENVCRLVCDAASARREDEMFLVCMRRGCCVVIGLGDGPVNDGARFDRFEVDRRWW